MSMGRRSRPARRASALSPEMLLSARKSEMLVSLVDISMRSTFPSAGVGDGAMSVF
jgi:hypothetical protein